MLWLEFDPLTDDVVPEVHGLWAATHWRARSAFDNRRIGDFQVVEFVGDPAYYVRFTGCTNGDYTKAGCIPHPCKTRAEAKAVVETLDAMQVAG